MSRSPDRLFPDESPDAAGAVLVAIFEEAVAKVLAERVDISRLKLLRIPEAAELLGISARGVYRMAAAGDLEFVRVGQQHRVTLVSIENYINAQRVRSEAAARRRRIRRLP